MVEFEGRGGDEGFVSVGIAAHFEVDHFDPTFFAEGFEGSSDGCTAEFGDGNGIFRDRKKGDDLVLAFCSFGESGQLFLRWFSFENGGFTDFCAGVFASDGGGDDRANDLFERGSVVGGDPLSELEEGLGDKWFRVDEAG